jgi:hypothetical protein
LGDGMHRSGNLDIIIELYFYRVYILIELWIG